MLPKFIGREKELQYLENIYKKNNFELTIIYGRRRVGKTELLKHFIKNKKSAYIIFTDESLEENIKQLKIKFAELTKKDFFLSLETKSLYDLFKYFVDEIKNEKIVFVIDEFSYLLSINKGYLATFQKIIDELLIKTKINLILCGSSLSIMENDVLGYRSPLYGRRINSWKLLPFNFKNIYSINKNIENSIEKYFVFGNIPYYLFFYDENINLKENIKQNFLTKGMNLYDEPLILLRQEFRESRTYKLILKYISLGYKSLGKLSSSTGLDKNNLMKYLSTLEETNLIKHILPLGMKRKGIYEINDNFFRFWFKFIYSNRDKLELGQINQTQNLIDNELNLYFGLCFEYFIEELFNSLEEFSNFNDVKKFWYKENEIDIVALNDKEILFCECKYKDNVDAEKIYNELKEKSKFVEHNKKENYAIFAKSFKKKIKKDNLKLYDLKDIGKEIINS